MTTEPDLRPLPKRWHIHYPIPPVIAEALSDFSPLMRQLLYNRGYEDPIAAAAYLEGSVTFSTNPFLLTGMSEAVERLHQAVMDGDLITIYGDYDVDGITSTAFLVEFLKALNTEVKAYIPNRYDEGYGLNDDAIRQLAAEGVQLVITVDCGVRAVSEVELANALGMDVIITDHHHPPTILPPAVAVIDPKQINDLYPEKQLAGVGLAYKLVQAYLARYPQEGVSAEDWIDLVALGTIADLAPLKGENRMLVRAGLAKIRQTPRQGLYSLAQVAGVKLEKCDASHIGFQLGPRLNAAGRLSSALKAFELLTTYDPVQAGQMAQELDSQNRERQDMTTEIREKAAQMVLGEDPEAFLFFAADGGFSEGVVGLAAGQLTESYYRPAIVAHRGELFTVASCRSIPEFHMAEALDACTELLVRHGGHAAAAGFTVRNEDCDALIARLKEIAAETLGDLDLQPVLKIDREIRLDKLTGEYISGILNDLHQLEPTGRENPEPVFASFGVRVLSARTIGKEGKHLKLTVLAGDKTYDAIAFQRGYWHSALTDEIDLAYCFEINEWNGRSTLQLNVKDIKAK